MRHERINYALVGLFVIIMALLFMAMVYRVTGKSGPVDLYSVIYDNVQGLKYGTPVYYEGYQVGQVEKVDPLHQGERLRYRVVSSVTRGWPIPVDSVARIVTSGLLAARSIDVRQGESRELLTPGSEIQGEGAVSLMSAINEAANQFRLFATRLQPMLENLSDRFSRLATSLDSVTREELRPLLRTTREELTPLLRTTRRRIDEAGPLLEKADTLLVSLNQSSRRLEQLLGRENQESIRHIVTTLETSAVNLNGLLYRIEETRQQMNQVLHDIDHLATDNRQQLRELVGNLHHSLEVVAQQIDSVTYNLDGATRNMNEFTRQIRENPALLLRGAPQPEVGTGKAQ